jgi:hypothetical protein
MFRTTTCNTICHQHISLSASDYFHPCICMSTVSVIGKENLLLMLLGETYLENEDFNLEC